MARSGSTSSGSKPRKDGKTAIPPEIRLERRWWHEIPMWLFYVPVAIGILAMLARYRSLSAPLCANYGLEHGGLHPDSKDAFFSRFSPDCPLLVRQTALATTLSPDEALARYEAFIKTFSNPRAVLKPDEGIQGMDVLMIGSADDFRQAWQKAVASGGTWLLQEFVGGVEAGLFYVRASPAEPGRIVSMTLKRGFPVAGDERRSIGELIQAEDIVNADGETRRRVAKYNRHQLERIPAKGEMLDLMPVRNHHLGATFQDISAFITDDLETGVVPHLDAIEGYHYGRLDARAPDYESLFAGKGIKVLEVNALYSEPVHAYDPRYGLGEAIGIFLAHWHMAVKAGLANQRAGKPRIAFWRSVFNAKT